VEAKVITGVWLAVAAAVGLAISLLPPTAQLPPVPVLLAAVALAVVGVIIGIRRMPGRVDLFHPLIFPTIYVVVASLGPALWIWGRGEDLGIVRVSPMSSQTPLLMALATVGFTVGAGLPFARRQVKERHLDSQIFGIAGRLLLLLPLFLAARGYLTGAVISRGEGQSVFTVDSTINAIGFITGPAAVTLILVSRYQAGKKLLGKMDAVLIVGLVGFLGLDGDRGSATAVMVLILLFATRRKKTNLRAVVGMLAVAAFAYTVEIYRTLQKGEVTGLSAPAVMLQDLGSAVFTTGSRRRYSLREGFCTGQPSSLVSSVRCPQ
jgi:hypothetical protein